jgi:4-azaleucine resistance transporter AzlC
MSDISFCKKSFTQAFVATIPVLLGYCAIGLAFGLLLVKGGYPWLIAPLMSTLIYAGALQYIALPMFAQNLSLAEIAIVTLLVNSRHIVYGLSLLEKFRSTKPYTWYMIFALTDETYSLLTSIRLPDDANERKFYFYVSLLDQGYWVIGSTVGALIGTSIHFNTKGLDFALTALFVVLLIEQIKICNSNIPFVIAAVSSACVLLIFGPQNMLILAIIFSIVLLFVARRKLNHDVS